MPINKKQLLRMIRFIGMLKENRYPSTKSFVKELRNEDISNNLNVCCTTKTIQRDIKTLKEEFNAPIEYDPEQKGYYLIDHGWNFPCPFFSDHELLASVLGARLAEDIFPEPLRSWVRQAVDMQLANNNPDFLDTAYVKSLKVFSGLKVKIDKRIFMTIFNCWVKHHTANITYLDPKNKKTERLIDPHALVFNDGAWFIKAWCHKRNEIRRFAIHRITQAEQSDKTFTPDQEIVSTIDKGNFFSYKEVKNVKLICDKSIVHFFVEKPLHPEQTINVKKDGSAELFIPEIIEHEIIQLVLYETGRMKAVKPKSLVKKIEKTARQIAVMHS